MSSTALLLTDCSFANVWTAETSAGSRKKEEEQKRKRTRFNQAMGVGWMRRQNHLTGSRIYLSSVQRHTNRRDKTKTKKRKEMVQAYITELSDYTQRMMQYSTHLDDFRQNRPKEDDVRNKSNLAKNRLNET